MSKGSPKEILAHGPLPKSDESDSGAESASIFERNSNVNVNINVNVNANQGGNVQANANANANGNNNRPHDRGEKEGNGSKATSKERADVRINLDPMATERWGKFKSSRRRSSSLESVPKAKPIPASLNLQSISFENQSNSLVATGRLISLDSPISLMTASASASASASAASTSSASPKTPLTPYQAELMLGLEHSFFSMPATRNSYHGPLSAQELDFPASPVEMGTIHEEKKWYSSNFSYDPVLFKIMDLSPKQIARQMALVDFNYFKKIEKEEYISLSWNGPDKWTKAPNIATFIQRFNNLTLWVSNLILESTNIRRRAEKLEHFINVAKACSEVNNFNGVKSILTSLQCTPIYRLHKTWALIGKSKIIFESLTEILSTNNNSEKYRKKLQKAKPPCIPYLGVHLSDITFAIEAGKAHDKHLSGSKHIDKVLEELNGFKNGTYDFEEIGPAVEFLSSPKFISEMEPFYEDKNYQLSLQLEPKDDNEPSTPKSSRSIFTWRTNGLKREAGSDSFKSGEMAEPPKPKVLLYEDSDSEKSGSDDEPSGIHKASKFFTASSVESLDEISIKDGLLVKKEITINFERSKNRAWKRYYVVLKKGILMFYKEKYTKTSATQSPSIMIDIVNESFVAVASDYKKRKNVFRLLPEQGTEFLFEAETEAEMLSWVASLEATIEKKRKPKGDLILM